MDWFLGIAIVLALMWAFLLVLRIGSKLIHLFIIAAVVFIAVSLVTS